MDSIEVEIEGVEETLRKSRKFVEAEERALNDVLEFIAKSIVNYAKKHAPFKDHTANLRNSIAANYYKMSELDKDTDPVWLRSKVPELEKPVVHIEGDDYVMVVGALMEYAIWVELKSGYWVLQGAIDKIQPLVMKYFKEYLYAENVDLEKVGKAILEKRRS